MEKNIYLSYLNGDEKQRMTDALSFLRSNDKENKAMFERIVNETYGIEHELNYPTDNGNRPSESTSQYGSSYYHTIVQFEFKYLTEDAIKALGENEKDQYCWRYFYAIAINKESRLPYLLSFSNACSPNWNNRYRVENAWPLKDVDFPILTQSGIIYRMCDSLHAAINDMLWKDKSTFTASADGIKMVVKDQHGNYCTIEGTTLEEVFRNYANNYTGYRNYRRQMASEWEIVNNKARESFVEWEKTAKGLKSDFDKFYGGGIVD